MTFTRGWLDSSVDLSTTSRIQGGKRPRLAPPTRRELLHNAVVQYRLTNHESCPTLAGILGCSHKQVNTP